MSRTYKIGFIGCGNMGSAMIGGVLGGMVAKREEIVASCRGGATAQRIRDQFGINCVTDNLVSADSDIVIIAVKPYQFSTILPQIREVISADQIIVSVAAGLTIQKIEEGLMTIDVAGKLKVVRAMPNTPALVGEAMTAIAPNNYMTDEDIKKVLEIFRSFGRAEVVPEDMMNVVTGVSGSSPAYIYMLIESMADAAVSEGMRREDAYTFAAQAVLGAAKMVLETGMQPGELKDSVCSPAGTTIEGVLALEEAGFRAAVAGGVRVSIKKAKEMS